MTKPMLIYIIGPYTGTTRADTENNIAAATAVAKHLVKAGYFPVIPQANSAFFDWDFKAGDAEFWYQGTEELLLRCDGAVCAPGWSNSTGSRAEVQACKDENIPLFFDVDSLTTAFTPEQFSAQYVEPGQGD